MMNCLYLLTSAGQTMYLQARACSLVYFPVEGRLVTYSKFRVRSYSYSYRKQCIQSMKTLIGSFTSAREELKDFLENGQQY